MTLTEDEAKTKFCPERRSDGDNDEDVLCAGSACMAWRWLVNEDHPDIDRTVGGIISVGRCGKAR